MSKVDEILGQMPNYIFDYLELSDEIKNEWRKGSKASDFGGHTGFKIKFKQALYKDLLELKEVSGMSLVSDGVWQKDYCIPVDKLKDYFGETND